MLNLASSTPVQRNQGQHCWRQHQVWLAPWVVKSWAVGSAWLSIVCMQHSCVSLTWLLCDHQRCGILGKERLMSTNDQHRAGKVAQIVQGASLKGGSMGEWWGGECRKRALHSLDILQHIGCQTHQQRGWERECDWSASVSIPSSGHQSLKSKIHSEQFWSTNEWHSSILELTVGYCFFKHNVSLNDSWWWIGSPRQ